MFADQGWPVTDVSHCLLLGDGLLSVSNADMDHMREIADELETAQPDDPYWAFSVGMIRVTIMFIERNLTAGLAASRQLLLGSGRTRSFRIVRDLLLGVHADMLAAQGEFDEALNTLSTAVTHPGHAVCFPMQRAGIMLHVGRERDVIDSTNACVACSRNTACGH